MLLEFAMYVHKYYKVDTVQRSGILHPALTDICLLDHSANVTKEAGLPNDCIMANRSAS